MNLLGLPERLKFPPVIEEAFQEDYFKNTLAATRAAAVFTVIVVVIHSILDPWTMPGQYHTAWLIRGTVMLPIVIIVFILSYRPGIRKVWQWLVALAVAITGVGITLIIIAAQPDSFAFSSYYIALFLTLIGGFFLSQLQFRYAFVANLIVLIFYEVAAIWFQRLLTYTDGMILFIFSNIFYLTGFFWCSIASYTVEQLRRRAFIQRYELTTQNAVLEAYAHMVAHDLKNPLTVTVGYLDILSEAIPESPDDDLPDLIHGAQQSSTKMLRIIEEMLLLASVRRQEDIPSERLVMGELVRGAIARLQNMIEESGAQIRVPVDWPHAIGYAPWIEEVLCNYISNAIKYGGTPPVIELGGERMTDGRVRYWVRDNGDGLNSEEKAKLFVEFSRLHSASRRKGHGLGLSITQRIMRRLGGSVGVESEPGKGSEFYFVLPAYREG